MNGSEKKYSNVQEEHKNSVFDILKTCKAF